MCKNDHGSQCSARDRLGSFRTIFFNKIRSYLLTSGIILELGTEQEN